MTYGKIICAVCFAVATWMTVLACTWWAWGNYDTPLALAFTALAIAVGGFVTWIIDSIV